MDLSALKAFAAVLGVLNLTEEQIQVWANEYKALHPDLAGQADAFKLWLHDRVTPEQLTALGQAALTDLVSLMQTGKGPISTDTDPAVFG